MMVVGGMAIFTIKFWTVLWYLAMWVDQNLILSMYPDVNVFLQIFANPGEHDAKRMLLNMITTSLYLGLPLLWSGMMAWAGVNIGRSITAATSPLARPADDAGRQGGSIGKMAISKGMKNKGLLQIFLIPTVWVGSRNHATRTKIVLAKSVRVLAKGAIITFVVIRTE